MVNTPPVAATIRDGKTFMLPGIMQTGKNVGMSTMDDALRDKALAGLIAKSEAIRRAESQTEMTAALEHLAD